MVERNHQVGARVPVEQFVDVAVQAATGLEGEVGVRNWRTPFLDVVVERAGATAEARQPHPDDLRRAHRHAVFVDEHAHAAFGAGGDHAARVEIFDPFESEPSVAVEFEAHHSRSARQKIDDHRLEELEFAHARRAAPEDLVEPCARRRRGAWHGSDERFRIAGPQAALGDRLRDEGDAAVDRLRSGDVRQIRARASAAPDVVVADPASVPRVGTEYRGGPSVIRFQSVEHTRILSAHASTRTSRPFFRRYLNRQDGIMVSSPRASRSSSSAIHAANSASRREAKSILRPRRGWARRWQLGHRTSMRRRASGRLQSAQRRRARRR